MNKRKYEKFMFFDVDELNSKMNTEWLDYKVINILTESNETFGNYYVAWIVKNI
jgi:hypothetical protein